jgi:hypothetical protein
MNWERIPDLVDRASRADLTALETLSRRTTLKDGMKGAAAVGLLYSCDRLDVINPDDLGEFALFTLYMVSEKAKSQLFVEHAAQTVDSNHTLPVKLGALQYLAAMQYDYDCLLRWAEELESQVREYKPQHQQMVPSDLFTRKEAAETLINALRDNLKH